MGCHGLVSVVTSNTMTDVRQLRFRRMHTSTTLAMAQVGSVNVASQQLTIVALRSSSRKTRISTDRETIGSVTETFSGREGNAS